MNILRNESGQALVLTLLSLTILLGFVGLATDVGTLFYTKRQLQIAADSAAIAGASEATFADVAASARADAARNGATDGTNGISVVVTNPYTPPVCPSPCTPANYVQVVVSQTQKSLFMSLFTANPVTVAARAVAYLKNNPGCIYALNNTGVKGLNLSGSALIFLDAPRCAMYINSNNNTSALASGFLDQITAKSIGIVGNPGYSSGGFTFFGTRPVGGIVPVADPLAYLNPPCSNDNSCGCLPSSPNLNRVVTTGQTLSPGTYCGTGGHAALTISSAAFVTLQPGLYIINGGATLGNTGAPASGGLNLTGSAFVGGTGVTFYLFNGAGFNIAGSGIQLTAPGSSGAYPGILIYQERGSATHAADAAPGSIGSIISSLDLEGAVYTPKGALSFPTLASITFSNYGIYVADTITFQGALGIFVDYANAPGSGGTSPIKGVALVE